MCTEVGLMRGAPGFPALLPGAGRKAGRAGWGAKEGKRLRLRLMYLLSLLREENSKARDPELQGRGPSCVGAQPEGGAVSCGERVNLGAQVTGTRGSGRAGDAELITCQSPLLRRPPPPSGLGHWGRDRLHCLNPAWGPWGSGVPTIVESRRKTRRGPG